ncbi:MAG: tRNA pseudouridine(38-40) synthase TruA [Planctomycetota bacterium]
MRTYLLTLGYNGTRYAGWQRQDGFETVQECMEKAVGVLIGETVTVHGAGRTDAGVHAIRQTAHVRLPRPFEPDELVKALNGNLPRDVAVSGAREVQADFHARFSATGKRYAYRFLTSPIRPLFGTGLYHWVKRPLDIDAMRRGASFLRGEHDFASFASNPGYDRTRGTVRRLDHVHIIHRPHGADLVVQGNGFLYNMVRAIAGTLQQVGLGKHPPEHVRDVLAAKDRSMAGMTAPPSGLYLVRVLYRREVLRM